MLSKRWPTEGASRSSATWTPRRRDQGLAGYLVFSRAFRERCCLCRSLTRFSWTPWSAC